ncbi:hypothetical protein [Nocardioides sp. Kera G14]|uniref:hypothetical protein n=1 Tax=Nocardioides sp. Kera G14 TaxID=2884264 RepID=UPI001D11A14D|nr:hypothetical protein [Nocardioides sp. Kera G14]UDY23706.1 hypothetical protein LH076_16845 [Nocardioides sp. Kera G14]
MSVLDRPTAVAAVVAAESAWVPGWQRIVTRAALPALPLLLAIGRLDAVGVAVVAAALALGSRLVPAVAAQSLHGGRRADIRTARERSLTAYVVAGLLLAGALARTGDDAWALAVSLTAAVLTLLQHRPPFTRPTLAVGAEMAESLALLGILPLMAMATRGWWQ